MTSLHFTVTGSPHIREIEGFLSASECAELLGAARAQGFDATSFNPEQRKAERLHTVDPKLSSAILKRLRPYLPEIVVIDGVRWRLNRFTHHWRYVHYEPGGHFVPHYDGAKLLPWHEMSLFTVQVYLDEQFEGGATRFYGDYVATRRPPHPIGYGEVRPFEPGGPPTHVVRPTTGKALVFSHAHNTLHDGEAVRSGEKDILRGDVLYSALPEDAHWLDESTLPPEQRLWSPEIAAHGGTRNFVGEVWQCGCGHDFCGMKLAEPPATKRLLFRNGEKLDFFQPGARKIKKGSLAYILISGKRAVGKDHIARRLERALAERHYVVCRASLGSINKRAYAEKMGVDLARLESDRAYKEEHRLALVAHHQERSRQDPAWALDQVVARARAARAEVLVLTDLRTSHDLKWFLGLTSGQAVVLRIDATDEARRARGWTPDARKDALPTETELDDYTGWMARFDNSDDGERGDALLREWIDDTVLSRLGEDPRAIARSERA